MLKKIFLIFVFSSLFFAYGCTTRPIHKTSEISGRVTDATTGKPIQNVIVSAVWLKSTPNIGGDVNFDIAKEYVVTDKDGKYVIPAKITYHIFSWFKRISRAY